MCGYIMNLIHFFFFAVLKFHYTVFNPCSKFILHFRKMCLLNMDIIHLLGQNYLLSNFSHPLNKHFYQFWIYKCFLCLLQFFFYKSKQTPLYVTAFTILHLVVLNSTSPDYADVNLSYSFSCCMEHCVDVNHIFYAWVSR